MATRPKTQAERQREYRQRLINRIDALEAQARIVPQLARVALQAHATGRINLGQYDATNDISIATALITSLAQSEVQPTRTKRDTKKTRPVNLITGRIPFAAISPPRLKATVPNR